MTPTMATDRVLYEPAKPLHANLANQGPTLMETSVLLEIKMARPRL